MLIVTQELADRVRASGRIEPDEFHAVIAASYPSLDWLCGDASNDLTNDPSNSRNYRRKWSRSYECPNLPKVNDEHVRKGMATTAIRNFLESRYGYHFFLLEKLCFSAYRHEPGEAREDYSKRFGMTQKMRVIDRVKRDATEGCEAVVRLAERVKRDPRDAWCRAHELTPDALEELEHVLSCDRTRSVLEAHFCVEIAFRAGIDLAMRRLGSDAVDPGFQRYISPEEIILASVPT